MADTPIADSVRTALPREAPALAALQRRVWQHSEVGSVALGGIDLAEMTEQWYAAIDRPPLAECRVLVALGDGELVGFATTSPSPDADAEPGVDGMVGEFVVDPRATGRGHGSRLLNACVDTLRADGFTRATCWVASTDDRLRTFLSSAGWAPDGAHRELGSEDGAVRLRQVRLHTDITPEDR
ncbi:GNAT family N-acetyltransferase [Desertihabitans brevis]|uniref:GNAT family N-acetyltransferase n=1 Tax=Desertihabitans brevis TaxID=2268447 RepID=A0A367YT27_9ACTN|nr:GNAT family N-acetyltransferase [Desertihabitans brevis]RCK68141.1 GNAT family N-acetyltransferase [Desertihabitans brevis]